MYPSRSAVVPKGRSRSSLVYKIFIAGWHLGGAVERWRSRVWSDENISRVEKSRFMLIGKLKFIFNFG
jgi:hypothetical protein